MKLDGRRAAHFLKSPHGFRAVLLHGSDEGAIRDYANDLARTIAGVDDPFTVVTLARGAWGTLPDEFASNSLLGGRRVVRIREATDALADIAKRAIAGPGEGCLVIEAPELGRGKLRNWAESAEAVATLAFYPEEGTALQATVRGLLSEQGVQADAAVLTHLAARLAPDRATIRREVEKLVLLVGSGATLTIEDAQAATGDAGEGSTDRAIQAALRGNSVQADRETIRALDEGLSEVALLRMLMGWLSRLHAAACDIEDGRSAADAVKSMRPPVFFREAPAITAVLERCSASFLMTWLQRARRLELACKQTGSNPALLVGGFIAELARTAPG